MYASRLANCATVVCEATSLAELTWSLAIRGNEEAAVVDRWSAFVLAHSILQLIVTGIDLIGFAFPLWDELKSKCAERAKTKKKKEKKRKKKEK
jgi:hypothetical protein